MKCKGSITVLGGVVFDCDRRAGHPDRCSADGRLPDGDQMIVTISWWNECRSILRDANIANGAPICCELRAYHAGVHRKTIGTFAACWPSE